MISTVEEYENSLTPIEKRAMKLTLALCTVLERYIDPSEIDNILHIAQTAATEAMTLPQKRRR